MMHCMESPLLPNSQLMEERNNNLSQDEKQQQHCPPSYVHPFSRYDQERRGSTSSHTKEDSPPPSSSPPIQFHSRLELSLAEKCIRKLVVDSHFFPARAAEKDWFRNFHSIPGAETIPEPYEAATTVTALYEHELSVGRLLGTGGFCQVRVVRLKKADPSEFQQEGQEWEDDNPQQKKYAIKYLCPNIKQKSKKAFPRGAADLAIEARFLSLLSHENIIKLHHVSAGSFRETYNCPEDDGFNDINEKDLRSYGYFLILDCLTGSLDGRIEKMYIPQVTKYLGEHPNKHHDHHHCDTRHRYEQNKHRPNASLPTQWWHWPSWHHEKSSTAQDSIVHSSLRQLLSQRLSILKCIASALQYLHENNIIMRDVKPNNIGFYNTGHQEIPKLFDFGLVKEMKQSDRASYIHECPFSKIVSVIQDYPVYKLTGRTGSRRYMSPEVAFSRPYNEKADVYSFGILLYEVSTLLQPFRGWTLDTHEEQVLKRHHRPCLVGYNYWPDELFSLIQDCWQDVMLHRPDMSEVVQRLDVCIKDLDASTNERTKASSMIDEAESSSSYDPKCCCPSPKGGHKNKHKFKQYLSTTASVFPAPTIKAGSSLQSCKGPSTQAQ